MNKIEFALALQEKLKGLPKDDLRRSLEYYNEMIDDRIEDGLSEAEAIEAIGSIDEITNQVLDEIPMTTLVKEKLRPKKKLETWQLVLVWVGCPLWASLLFAAAAVVFSLYVYIWSVLIALYASTFAVAVTAVVSIPAAILFLFVGNPPISALLLFSCGLILAGLSIFMTIGCQYLSKGIIWVSKHFWLWLKSQIVGKEAAK